MKQIIQTKFLIFNHLFTGFISSLLSFHVMAYPNYSLQNMPRTGFSCRDKILGGYYADSETQCQMFHVCLI